MSTCTSAAPRGRSAAADEASFPTETEIYIRPDGRIIIADLPAELVALVAELGEPEPCEVGSDVAQQSGAHTSPLA